MEKDGVITSECEMDFNNVQIFILALTELKTAPGCHMTLSSNDLSSHKVIILKKTTYFSALYY